MRTKRVNRYYCDFCKKGGCSGGAMKKHESRCTRNPDRVCGFCKEFYLEQKATADLLAALQSDGGLEAVREIAGGCPACMMAAIHALRKIEPLVATADYGDTNFIDFNYREAADAFFASERRSLHGMERQ